MRRKSSDYSEVMLQVDRTSSIPLYRQVQNLLLEHVRQHNIQPGERLWSEHEIVKHFGVARSVARQALIELENHGIVERQSTRGTFLSSARPMDRLLSSARGLHDDAASRGTNVTSDVITCEIDVAPEGVAHLLDLPEGAERFHLVRVRHDHSGPWTFVDSSMPADLVPGIEEHDFREGSLYTHLSQRYGIHLARAERSVEAEAARREIAEHLDIKPGEPVLVLRSIGYDATGRVVDFFIAWHRADRSRFVVDVVGAKTGGHVMATDSPAEGSP